MKYFTQERLDACQNPDYDSDECDVQIDLYKKHIEQIPLPDSVKLFMNTCQLHDANMDIWTTLSQVASKNVQLVFKTKDFVCILRYKLAKPGHVAQITADYCSFYQKFHRYVEVPHMDWLYDEFDYLGEVSGGKIFTHNILFSNNTELIFYFNEFHFLFLPTTGLIEA